MPIPSYKQVHIKSDKRELIFEQLILHLFGQVPYIFSISHLGDQIEALKSIEDFIEENELSNYPYPNYIISSIKNYSGSLNIFKSLEECPSFFKQKIKQLNIKENKILQKIYLKQNKIKNMRDIEYRPYLEEYGHAHKKMSDLYNEEFFLKNILTKLEDFYDKKER